MVNNVDSTKRILFVHAHPDDEVLNNGGTIARYVSEGAQVSVVFCTKGEKGIDIESAELSEVTGREMSITEKRMEELVEAMKILRVRDYRFLSSNVLTWEDSGNSPSDIAGDPEAFVNIDIDVAAEPLAAIIQSIRPHVMVTYDPHGGYGHPDHIKTHEVSIHAAALAAANNYGNDDCWHIQKIYWTVFPEQIFWENISFINQKVPMLIDKDFSSQINFLISDKLVTSLINAEKYSHLKISALRNYKSQIISTGYLFESNEERIKELWGREYYMLASGDIAGPFDSDGRETDLFSGITLNI